MAKDLRYCIIVILLSLLVAPNVYGSYCLTPAVVIKETPLYFQASLNSAYDYLIPLNFDILIDIGDEDSPAFYWAEIPAIVDGEEVVLKGFLYCNHVGFESVTTEEDFDAYESTIRKQLKEADWKTMLKNPTAHKNNYTSLSFQVGSVTLDSLYPHGVYADIITDEFGRFIVEMPYPEMDEDWSRGWYSEEWIDTYITFSHIGEYTNSLGVVFRLPVFKALAVYNGYRLITP